MNRIILALDVKDEVKALTVLKEVSDHIAAVKLNYPIVLSLGMGIIDKCAEYASVICDFKVADIPNTNELIFEEIKKHKAEGVIIQGFCGSDVIRSAVQSGLDVYVVCEMSHPGGAEFIQQHGIEIAKLARKEGAKGIIAPGTRPERIKILKEIVGDLKILSPGIGAQGGSANSAIKAGADYLIVGRSIYNAEKPKDAISEIMSRF